MQGRGTAHFHSAIHVKDAPILDINPDSAFTAFAYKYIKCQLPDPELYELVSSRQCHHHTRTCKKTSSVFVDFVFQNVPLIKLLFQEFQRRKMQIPLRLLPWKYFQRCIKNFHQLLVNLQHWIVYWIQLV